MKVQVCETMSVECLEITPQMAERYLERNHPLNRPVGLKRVAAKSRDMLRGDWKLTHQGICLDGNGNLIDGQHRLRAVIESGVTVQMLVFTNQVAKLSDPMDRHRSRSVSFITGIDTSVVAACRLISQLELSSEERRDDFSPAEVVDIFSRHKEAFTAITKTRVVSGALAAVVWAYPINPEVMREFYAQVAHGEMLQAGDPAYALRNWISTHRHARPYELCLATCSCINACLEGRKIAKALSAEKGLREVNNARRLLGLTAPKKSVFL